VLRRSLADITGRRFGALTAQWPAGKKGNNHNMWLCLCQCGNLKLVFQSNLVKSSHSTSCGCLRTKQLVKRSLRHGQSYEKAGSYGAWLSMKQRCLNSNNKRYIHYGGRGITICDRWLNSFESFFADMGVRPEGLTLDSINNDANYEPGNCRWATWLQQRHNRRPNPPRRRR